METPGPITIDHVFYDSHCGFCQGWVRFIVMRDRRGVFHFAPLHGETFRNLVPESERGNLPDSVVVVTADGKVLTRSTAAVHLLGRLAGPWRVFAAVIGVLPRPLRDCGYDRVASVRRLLAAKPVDACPVVPVELRQRFER